MQQKCWEQKAKNIFYNILNIIAHYQLSIGIKLTLQAWKCGKCNNSEISPVKSFGQIFWHLLNCNSSVKIVLTQVPYISVWRQRWAEHMGRCQKTHRSTESEMKGRPEWATIYGSTFSSQSSSTFGVTEFWNVWAKWSHPLVSQNGWREYKTVKS